MITEAALTKAVNRLMILPFAGAEPEVLEGRAREFKRVLRAGIRSDQDLGVVVDDLIEHCEACPPPAAVVDAIRRCNTATAEHGREKRADEERQDWPKLYGKPDPVTGDAVLGENCLCGTPWREVFAISKRNNDAIAKMCRSGSLKGVPRRTYRPYPNSWFEELESDYALAKRLLPLTWHSDTCTARE